MKYRRLLSLLLLGLSAQLSARTDSVECLKPVSMRRYGAPPAHYSGIARIGADRYALVSDKEPLDGYYPLRLQIDTLSGKILSLRVEACRGLPASRRDDTGFSARDAEGVAYNTTTETLFISGEGDQDIHEYDINGVPTGRKLVVPPFFSATSIHPNYGFEALTYDGASQSLWTTTESTLRADGESASPRHPEPNRLRLQRFGSDLKPREMYLYQTDTPRARHNGRAYAFGVTALAALPDGDLLVLERELFVSKRYGGSWATVNLYRISPRPEQAVAPAEVDTAAWERSALPKRKVASWTTRFHPLNTRLANYEGMCLGPRLSDGRQTLVLVSDSQGGYGKGPYRLKDYLRVVVLPAENE